MHLFVPLCSQEQKRVHRSTYIIHGVLNENNSINSGHGFILEVIMYFSQSLNWGIWEPLTPGVLSHNFPGLIGYSGRVLNIETLYTEQPVGRGVLQKGVYVWVELVPWCKLWQFIRWISWFPEGEIWRNFAFGKKLIFLGEDWFVPIFELVM